MFKVQVKKEDIASQKKILSSRPKSPIGTFNPLSQAFRRILKDDPRWRKPQVEKNSIVLIPKSKYANVGKVSFPLTKKMKKYYSDFEKWYSSNFSGKSIKTIDFSVKGFSVDNGRLKQM